MKKIPKSIAAQLLLAQIVVAALMLNLRTRAGAASEDNERGAVTIEQIIWAVALAVLAVAVSAIVVGLVNAKAGELKLG